MRIGLRFRFIFLLATILLSLFGILTYVIIQRNVHDLRSSLNQKSIIFSQLATKPIADTFLLYKDSGTARITQQAKQYYDLDSDVRSVLVIDATGKVMHSYGDDSRKQVQVNDDGNFNPTYQYEEDVITQVIQPYIEDFGGHRYSLVYTFSSENINQQIDQVRMIILKVGLAFLFASMAIAYFLFNRAFIKPVRELSKLAVVISSGNLNQQIYIKRKDEIGEMAKSVNTMAEKLKADINELRKIDELKNEFMMIASHNLRTPLTIISGYIEMVENAEDDKQIIEFMKVIKTNTLRLTEFSEDMLTMATMEGGTSKISKEDRSLRPLLEKIDKDFKLISQNKKIKYEFKTDIGDSRVMMSATHLRSAIWNIMDNAIKFSDEGGSVSFNSFVENNSVVIIITDKGIGISESEKAKLFTKFHRGTDTVHYNFEGVGIGLYLTKLIIEKHGGTIDVVSEIGRGSEFTITLPLTK